MDMAHTHSDGGTGHPQGNHRHGRVGSVCWLEGRGGDGASVKGILVTLGRAWGGGYLGWS